MANRPLQQRRTALCLNVALVLLHILAFTAAAADIENGRSVEKPVMPFAVNLGLSTAIGAEPKDDSKHILKKRSSDEDVDYEVYQGVVGRPGIDFPIYPRIPKTSFSCRSFGNGYFADMETDCQVFHICEEGRKISFLCPNGTIFQQSELTCDWWFKVNCLGSPGYYADSAEILTKQRLQRIRPSVPVQGFNIVGGGLDIKPRITKGPAVTKQRARVSGGGGSSSASVKSDRRMDSVEHSPETVDFDDLSGEKSIKGQPLQKIIANNDYNNNQNNNNNADAGNNNNNEDESQITAESASFVAANRRQKFGYDKSTPSNDNRAQNDLFAGGRRGSGSAPRSGFMIGPPKPFSSETSTETRHNGNNGNGGGVPFRSGHPTTPRHREERKPFGASFEKKTPNKSSGESTSAEGRPKKSSFSITSEVGGPTKATPTLARGQQVNATTSFPSGTYSTARRLDNTRTTPFYTPTVPSIAKAKTTESKGFYVKNGKGSGGGGNGGGLSASTPNPNRLSPATGTGAALLFDSSPGTKNSLSATTEYTANAGRSTLRPLIIGFRHDSSLEGSAESPRNGGSKNTNNWTDQSARKTATKANNEGAYSTTTTRPLTTGPTYLPKNAARPKKAGADSAGDEFLFAPGPLLDGGSVTRNVDDMLKTINLLKDGLGENKYPGPAREGLEIPPSSGPDVLISLAKYFATEEKSAGKKPDRLTKISVAAPVEKFQATKYESTAIITGKPSDTTATLTTLATPVVAVKGDDITAGLLREKTVHEYSNLFGIKDAKAKSAVVDPSAGLLSNAPTTNRPKDTFGLFPNIASTDATIRELAEKPDSRKIAQVFSNALTTYLEDPASFREQLAAVRPTEPPRSTPNFTPVTASDANLFRSGTGATYLPTRATTTQATHRTTVKSIAAEINRKFEGTRTTSNSFISTTDYSSYETTTITPKQDQRSSGKTNLDFTAELLPPNADSSGEEFLQREQTQSFVASRNQLTADKTSNVAPSKGGRIATTAASGGTGLPTENPWVHISQTDFLDPLTINDGLMRESTTTSSPFTYLPKRVTPTAGPASLTTTLAPKAVTTTASRSTTTTWSSRNRTPSQRLELQANNRFVGSAEVTTIPPSLSRQRASGASSSTSYAGNSWQDIFDSYDIPRETLPSSSGLQRIANKLFGGLNETEALHLKNVMLQAEHNRQVLGLLLLLIQTCDDQNGKALERSRKHLLNALIDMDSKLRPNGVGAGKTSHQKATPATQHATSTGRVPVTTTTTSSSSEDSQGFSTSTLLWSTTTESPSAITTTLRSWRAGIEDTTKFEIRVPDLDDDAVVSTVSPAQEQKPATSSDKRALELLKSLYSLASKFSSRR